MRKTIACVVPSLATLALAACTAGQLPAAGFSMPVTATASGKAVASATAAGADLLQASRVVELARSVYEASGHADPVVLADVAKARDALAAAGQSLAASHDASGDLRANVALAEVAVHTAVTALGAVSAADQARVQGYLDSLQAAISLYNGEAAAAGLPVVPAV